jgi:hypothetical protein
VRSALTRFFILLGVIALGVIIWLVVIVLRSDDNAEIPKEMPCAASGRFNLYPHLMDKGNANLMDSFPYEIYLDSADRCDVTSISRDLISLDSVNPDNKNQNREILSIALTNKLEERLKPSFDKYNPDSLIYLVQWAEKFNQFKDFDRANAKLYRVIYKHWIQFVANKLRESYDREPKHKYDFKFQYLTSICQSKNLTPPIGNTAFEKVIYHLITKNYTYLFRKFWYDTGFLYKLAVVAFLSFTCYGYYLIVKRLFTRPKK